jgi:chromosome segregation ATPase
MPGKILLPCLIAIMFLFSACGTKEIERLTAENDSLRRELETRHSMVAVMRDVTSLLDSIDSNRKLLRADLNEGITQNDFSSRLKDINSYVKKTEDKIKSIEKQMKSAKREVSAYLMMMDALKSELAIRVGEVEELEKAVEQYKAENQGLIHTVKLQETQMADMQTKIEVRQQELVFLETKVKEMVSNFKVSEAEAMYSRARAVEEAANRTRLAPRKKKETYKEALELYKKASSLGKKEAKKDITRLEKKVKVK